MVVDCCRRPTSNQNHVSQCESRMAATVVTGEAFWKNRCKKSARQFPMTVQDFQRSCFSCRKRRSYCGTREWLGMPFSSSRDWCNDTAIWAIPYANIYDRQIFAGQWATDVRQTIPDLLWCYVILLFNFVHTYQRLYYDLRRKIWICLKSSGGSDSFLTQT